MIDKKLNELFQEKKEWIKLKNERIESAKQDDRQTPYNVFIDYITLGIMKRLVRLDEHIIAHVGGRQTAVNLWNEWEDNNAKRTKSI